MPSYFARKIRRNSETRHPILKWAGRFFMSLGILFCISITISLLSLAALLKGGGEEQKPLPQSFVLVDEFKGVRADVNTTNPLIAQFIPQSLSLYGFLSTLKAAKEDDRVTHFVVVINDGDYTLDQIQTLRRAIADFRSSGKKAIAYTDNFGGFSNGMGEYWLATAFDEIWLNPLGLLSINGIHIEQPFFKDALDKIGVTMEAEQREDYKTGAEMYLRQSMSEENRETMQAIIDDIMDVMMTDIESARGIPQYRQALSINRSPLLAQEALELGFIDHIGSMNDLETVLKGDDDDQKDLFVGIMRYAKDVRAGLKGWNDRPTIAIVDLDGMIIDMEKMANANHPLAFAMPEQFADAPIIKRAINQIAEDDDVDVMILRVSSPGGTPEASEMIRQAVQKARDKGKYVIVSMADVAASGGYWVSVNGDEIIADDLTLTGSIGVYGGKPDLSGLWNMIGVNWQAMQYGDNAGIWSTNKPFTDAERARYAAMMDHTYDVFVGHVAKGRKMKRGDANRVAQGRAWTGRDALDNGLIDRLGGFDHALAAAADHVGLEDWTDARVIALPVDEDPFDDLMAMLGLPSLADAPKLPRSLMSAIVPHAIVSAPYTRIDF
jgi:protease-4